MKRSSASSQSPSSRRRKSKGPSLGKPEKRTTLASSHSTSTIGSHRSSLSSGRPPRQRKGSSLSLASTDGIDGREECDEEMELTLDRRGMTQSPSNSTLSKHQLTHNFKFYLRHNF